MLNLRPVLAKIMNDAGRHALSHFNKVQAEVKPDGSFVTAADREVETLIAEALTRQFPGVGVISEEGTSIPSAGDTWFVDPIDGTSSFLAGLAHWGPSLSLVSGGEVVAGAFYEPCIGRLWFTELGGGAWRDEVRLRPADPGEPSARDIVFVPSGFHRGPQFAWPGKIRALGSSAAHLALVAGGGGMATGIFRWKLWDVGAGVLLMNEAGRQTLQLDGSSFHPIRDEGLPFLAGAPTALRYLTRLFKGQTFPSGN
jgi:myo-inositol-1(or 4)-monophosphatase